jgi:hypothetical protein
MVSNGDQIMPKTIHLSNGSSKPDCVLCVRNVTGIAEERGFRLYWAEMSNPDLIVPALGLVTSNPFRTAGAAAAYGKRHLGEDVIYLLTETGLRRMPK